MKQLEITRVCRKCGESTMITLNKKEVPELFNCGNCNVEQNMWGAHWETANIPESHFHNSFPPLKSSNRWWSINQAYFGLKEARYIKGIDLTEVFK